MLCLWNLILWDYLQSLVTFPLRIREGKIEVQYTKPEPPAFRLIGDRNQG